MNNQTLLIDFDSTICTRESLDMLAEISLIGQPREEVDEILQRVKDITNAGMKGEISFTDSLSLRLSELNLHRVHVLQTTQYLSLSCNISPSFNAHRDEIKQHAKDIYIISGGIREIILPVAEHFGIDASHVFANDMRYDEHWKSMGVDQANPLAHEGGKVKVAQHLKDRGIITSPIIAIGDGITDWQLREAGVADRFLAYTETVARPSVVARGDKVVSDFSEVRSYLGWGQSGIEHIGMRGEAHAVSMRMRR